MAPGHDIHHRLRIGLRQCLIEAAEQLLVAILRTAADEQGRTGIVVNLRDILIVVQTDNHRQVARQALPRQLQGQQSASASLQMGMVWGRGTTLRAIVEHHQFRVFLE